MSNTAEPEVQLELFEPIHKVPLTFRAELDHRNISVRELLGLRVDSVLELSKSAGENINLYAGEILLGSGEILVIDSSLAVRITELKDKRPDPVTHDGKTGDLEQGFIR